MEFNKLFAVSALIGCFALVSCGDQGKKEEPKKAEAPVKAKETKPKAPKTEAAAEKAPKAEAPVNGTPKAEAPAIENPQAKETPAPAPSDEEKNKEPKSK